MTKKLIWVIVILLIAISGCLGYAMHLKSSVLVAPNMLNKNYTTAELWCKELKKNDKTKNIKCEVIGEEKADSKVGIVFYQSVNADKEISSGIVFKYAKLVEKPAEETPTIKTETVEEYSDVVPAGETIRTEKKVVDGQEIEVIYISKGKSQQKDNNEDKSSVQHIYVDKNQYIDKTEDDFKTIANNLGLNPTHLSERDAYSDLIAKGKIVTHGYGYYEKNENFNYGLSLGKEKSSVSDTDLYIEKTRFIGQSESTLINVVKELTLVPKHLSDRDGYSDEVTKGLVLTHGYGQYVEGEDFNYGLSLGPKPAEEKPVEQNPTPTPDPKPVENNEKIVIDNSYIGMAEADFIKAITDKKLKAAKGSEQYSDNIQKGSVISYNTGEFNSGDTINYNVSLGKQEEEKASILRPQYYQVGETFDATKSILEGYFSSFSNVRYEKATSNGEAIGQILKITVNGDESYASGDYVLSTPIVVYIVNEISS